MRASSGRRAIGVVVAAVLGAGCPSPGGDGARSGRESATVAPDESSTGAGDAVRADAPCPELAAPPAGRCRSNADCSGQWVECAWGEPKPGPRPTGSGALFGTDDVRCEHGYQEPNRCPDGQAMRMVPAANLCPVPECLPRCSASSCAAGESCDQGTGLCRPISCRDGWRCAADQICQHGPNADPHGCAPRCPGYGKCVVYGPPLP